MQENLAEAERRIEEARRTQAERLDLGDLALGELPASLGGLVHLRKLYLGTRKPTQAGDSEWDSRRKLPGLTDLSPLARLKGLESLDLSDCRGITDLFPLARLHGLHNLNLWGSGVTDLAPLAGLQGLQSLLLSSTGVTDLAPLAGLKELQSLHLPNTSVTDLAPLSGLQSLKSLDLSSTDVTDLAPLAGLQGLQELFLGSTGATDLAPLVGLHGLQGLFLSNTGVTELYPLAELQGLKALDLSYTDVTNLVPLAGLQELQSLYLSSTGVTDLSPLTTLEGLQRLHLYGCRPAVPARFLRLLTNHPSLTILVVDEAVGVPREVLSAFDFDNCLLRLRIYLSELNLGTEAENEVKVILLGNGRVGKTQLCRRFRGQPFDETVESTHGVQIWREELRIRTGDEGQVFQVNWWDFGGQDIYHGTHALFLRSRAVFLILWTPTLENRDEYEESGIPLRNQPLAYWLDYVRTLAGEGSPVIVVQSQCDRFADRRPDPPRPDGLGFFECCAYSAKKDRGRAVLEDHLRDAMLYLLERNGTLEIGHGRAEVRRQLYEWRSEDQTRAPEERHHRTLTCEEFRALCEETGGIVSWTHALAYFHHTGVVFYRPDLFSDRIVLDQTWALDAIYAVFHRGRAVPFLRDSGRFTRDDLAILVWQEHSTEEQRLFLGLMESCGVCFPWGQTAHGEPRYVAPDLLPRFEAIAGRLFAWKDEPGTPTLRLEYRFFHQALIWSLMSRIGQEAGDLAEYWKYGFWLKDGQRDTQLLVQFEDTSTYEAPGAGALELKGQGRDPLGLLREIRKAILEQRIGEKPEELLTLEGTTVARSALESVIDDGRVLDLRKKLVSGAAFTAFFTDREHDPGEVQATGETNGIDINPQPLNEEDKPRREVLISYAATGETTAIGIKPQPLTEEDKPRREIFISHAATGETPAIGIKPQPLTEEDKPRREVFISYAWGDATPEGRLRTQVCDALYSALEEDGFHPVRDRDQIRPGDRISAFIRHLTRADFVVAIISDKYLRSFYCMYEIYTLWQKSQEDADFLAACLVPIVLPEVKIEGLRDRAPYIRYWREQKKELVKVFRELGPDLDPGSLRELRLVRDFAQDVDGILRFFQDVFMPRKLEVHLDDGFQAVREALRRRMGVGG